MVRTSVIVLHILFIAASCIPRKGGHSTSERSLPFEVESFSVRDQYPGVASDLLKVRSFSLNLKLTGDELPEFKALACDSVMIEPAGEPSSAEVKNGRMALAFHREMYRAGSFHSASNVREVPDDLRLPADVHQLVLRYRGREVVMELPSPEVLPTLHAP